MNDGLLRCDELFDQRIVDIYLDLKIKIRSREILYGMLSNDFCNRFQRGDLPEKEEYFRWRNLYSGLKHMEKSYPWLVEQK